MAEEISASDLANMASEAPEAAAAPAAPASPAPTATTSTTAPATQTSGTPPTSTTGAAVAPAAPTAADWQAMAMPPEAIARFGGAKTIGDAFKRFQASSSEARAKAERERELLAQIDAFKKAAPQQTPTQPQVPTPAAGFDIGKFNEEFARDPAGAWNKLFDQEFERRFGKSAEQNLVPLLEKKIQERFAPLQERETRERYEHQRRAAFERYPEFSTGEGYEIASQFVESAPDVAKALETVRQNHPDVNVTEIVGKLANYDYILAQNATLRAQLEGNAKKSATAKPGTSAPAKPQTGNWKDDMRAELEEQGVPGADNFIASLERATR